MDSHKCEGSCIENYGSHKGDVKEVLVSSEQWQPMTFFYCENAIDEDIKRGFTVIIKKGKA